MREWKRDLAFARSELNLSGTAPAIHRTMVDLAAEGLLLSQRSEGRGRWHPFEFAWPDDANREQVKQRALELYAARRQPAEPTAEPEVESEHDKLCWTLAQHSDGDWNVAAEHLGLNVKELKARLLPDHPPALTYVSVAPAPAITAPKPPKAHRKGKRRGSPSHKRG